MRAQENVEVREEVTLHEEKLDRGQASELKGTLRSEVSEGWSPGAGCQDHSQSLDLDVGNCRGAPVPFLARSKHYSGLPQDPTH